MKTISADIGLITTILRRHRIFGDDDMVFVGGSVADGLATPWSDVDVFVIRRDAKPAEAGLHLIPMPHDEMPMDLEVWSSGEVDALLDKLHKIQADAQTDHRAFMRLTEDERDFLHCLAGGIPVHNQAGLARLQAKVDRGLLARLSIARALVGITNSQTDLLGWLALGDWQSVGTACQRLIDFSALALLGASGSTHPGGKWIITLLRSRFEGRLLPSRLLGGAASLVDRYYALQRRPASSEAVDGYARECVDFSNRAVIYAQTVDSGIPGDTLQRIFWLPQSPPPADGQPRPALSCAVQMRFDSGKWCVLHVGREMYEVNAAAIGMLLLVDGRATEQQILAVLQGLSSVEMDRLEPSLRDLLMFLDNANLRAS